MKCLTRILSLLTAMAVVLGGAAMAEAVPSSPVAVVSYDRDALIDWMPSYRPTVPGMLLELTHTEGMLSVSTLYAEDRTPADYLSERLDRAGETLAVSDAQIDLWSDPFHGDGRCLSFSYTYPEGDELHLTRMWTATYMDGILIELSVDTWGEEAALLMDTAYTAMIEGGFTVTYCENAAELIATLSGVTEGEDGLVQARLTPPVEAADAQFYPLSPDAVVLLPNPDDPSLFYPVAPEAASLIDAILTYEEHSGTSASFRAIIAEGQIIYMEYSPLQ